MFLLFISTQSDEPPRGMFRSKFAVTRSIQHGKAQGAVLLILYEFPEDIANDRGSPPGMAGLQPFGEGVTSNRDRSITTPRLEQELGESQVERAGDVVCWASLHLNLEIGLAHRSDRWIGADYSQQAADKTLTLDELLSRSEVIVMGVDGGGLDDLLGVVVLGRDEKTRR